MKDLDYTTDAFGREAVAFIEKYKSQPWFLYLAFNAVHTPMQATDDRLAKFPGIGNKRRRTYDAMTLALDEAGRHGSQRELSDTGIDGNTIVVFISDNGGPTMRTTINGSRNTPLRGSKRTTLEGGIRVPFVISWPGHLKPGVYDQPTIQLDANVTALTAAGVDIKPEWKLDGIDLMPYLSGRTTTAPHEALYWRFGQQMAIRMGDYKLVRYDSNADTLTGRPKQPVTAPKLYRLSDDIGESKDLLAAMPERVKELQTKWDAWNATLVKPLWGNGNSDDDGAEPGAPAKKGKAKKVAGTANSRINPGDSLP